MRGRIWISTVILSTLFSVGCGSGSSNTAQLRFVQGSPDAPMVKLLIDGKTIASNLAYGNVSGYITVKSGSRHVQVVPVSGSSAILDQTVSINASANQTIILMGPVAAAKSLVLTDGGTTVTTGDGHVRVVSAATAMGVADVYIVPAGSSIAGVTPTKAGVSFDQDTGYQLAAQGSYQVFMTVPGTANAFLNTGAINLTSAQNQTVIALDGVSGGFTFALLVDQ